MQIQIQPIARGFLAVAILFSNAVASGAALYQEPFRPQFHFTPERHWMNDPNGLLFYEGEYHLFYQFNPFGDKWGHMSWGHAVSRDLVRWQHLPVALPEQNGVMIFSGSAVVDWKNTSGFGREGKPPLVAIYTGHYTEKPLQNQHIAYSNDRGRTWIKYSGNPVLDIGEKDFRDPKVFWHDLTRQWIMTVSWPVPRKVRFYSSPDLKNWTHLSDFGPAGSTKGIWECPDLFPLAVEKGSAGASPESGRDARQKWVLIVNVGSGASAGGSGCQYFVGDFDGTRFTLDESSAPKSLPAVAPEGRLLADFEGSDYSGWRVAGNAFGSSPAGGAMPNQQVVSGFRGAGLVNSFLGGDSAQGTLTSPEFDVSQDYLNFLMGGGTHSGQTCMNLLVDGKAVRTATGDNAEHLDWKSWSVREFRGRKAILEIVDRRTDGWGHISVDQIVLAGAPARPAREATLWADYGRDFYAAVSWSDVPKSDGRRLWIGWMSNWEYAQDVPTSPWRSAMSVPRELVLRSTPDGLRLAQRPVRELRKLRRDHHRLRNATFSEASSWLGRRKFAGGLLEIEIEIESPGTAGQIGLRFRHGAGEETVVTCDMALGRVQIDRLHSGRSDFHPKFAAIHEAPLRVSNRAIRLHLLLDTSSLEVFANDGESVLTDLILPAAGSPTLELFSSSDSSGSKLERLDIWELKSAWR